MRLKDLLGKLKGKTANRVHVDRAPRVRINYLHDLEFVATQPQFSAPLKIDNISSSGVGLILPEDADFASLTKIVGDLKFKESSHKLELNIVRFNGDHVGAKIESPPASFVLTLQKYFESEIEALRLRAARTDYLKPVPNGMPHWYQGSNNCDLSYVSNGNDVVEFALTVFGNHLEGGAGKALRYSEISEKAKGESAKYKGSDLLHTQRTVDAEMIVLAKRVLNAVEGLPEDHRTSLLKFLN